MPFELRNSKQLRDRFACVQTALGLGLSAENTQVSTNETQFRRLRRSLIRRPSDQRDISFIPSISSGLQGAYVTAGKLGMQ